MAFICTITPESVHLDVFQENNSWSIVYRIGYDKEKCKNYFVNIGLSPNGGCIEYYFFILEVDANTKEETPYWSGNQVAEIFDKASKNLILSSVCAATAKLLDAVKPDLVFRCTHDVDPPEKALEKHYILSKVFETCGYQIETADQWHGKRAWYASRTTKVSAS